MLKKSGFRATVRLTRLVPLVGCIAVARSSSLLLGMLFTKGDSVKDVEQGCSYNSSLSCVNIRPENVAGLKRHPPRRFFKLSFSYNTPRYDA